MSSTLLITGGTPLTGEVTVSGAKNAATKMMIASLLTDEPVVLQNCPQIEDVDITSEICQAVGTTVTREGSTLTLHTSKITNTTVKKLSRSNRLPILALSPLLTRAGHASVPVVGGDAIGPRPVNFHIDALAQMGANIERTETGYEAKAQRLHGTTIHLPYPSVGATENIILAAVLAQGRTYIHNAAVEPEVMDVIKLLQRMGAIIEFRANRTIIIDGVERLHGVTYSILPDRLEAASFALLAAATDGNILVKQARQEELLTFLNTMRRIGVAFSFENGGIRFYRGDKPLQGIELETETYPGFATDWQQPTVVLLTQAEGTSVVHETVYEDRFGYTESLKRMGADVTVFSKCLGELSCRFKGRSDKHSAIINGPKKLRAASIDIPDIRAGMAHVLAALIAEGTSELTGIEHLMRGYENFLPKLEAIGAKFELKS